MKTKLLIKILALLGFGGMVACGSGRKAQQSSPAVEPKIDTSVVIAMYGVAVVDYILEPQIIEEPEKTQDNE